MILSAVRAVVHRGMTGEKSYCTFGSEHDAAFWQRLHQSASVGAVLRCSPRGECLEEHETSGGGSKAAAPRLEVYGICSDRERETDRHTASVLTLASHVIRREKKRDSLQHTHL